MSTTLASVMEQAAQLWPLSGAETWDAPGLVTGDPKAQVKKVLLAVDPVTATVTEAIEQGCQLLITHHPLLLRGVTSVSEEHYKGALVARLIRGGCGLYTAHTNADVVPNGVSDTLASMLGLVDAVPLVPGERPDTGLGRVGELPNEITLGELAKRVAQVLPPVAGGVRVAGDFSAPVRRVALCGGAGDSLLSNEAVVASDVYITADLRHHPASEAREAHLYGFGPALIDVSHWASEWLWLADAAARLNKMFSADGVQFTVSELRTDPWDFAIMQ